MSSFGQVVIRLKSKGHQQQKRPRGQLVLNSSIKAWEGAENRSLMNSYLYPIFTANLHITGSIPVHGYYYSY